VILDGGATFLLSCAASGGSTMMPVPEQLHAPIRTEHPSRSLIFPRGDSAVSENMRPMQQHDPSLLWVDPLKINRVYASADIREVATAHDGVRAGDWDRGPHQSFVKTDSYIALVEYLVLNREWDQTKFYRRVAESIEQGTKKFGSSTVDEFRERGTAVRRLYNEIREGGYKTQAELPDGRARDEVRVAIARDGRFLFIDGRHRLTIARILGIPAIPVRVSLRHPDWEAFKEDVAAYAAKREGRVYQVIDHPDLADVPAHHGTERVGMIKDALANYDATDKTLMDIGTHWGYMARQLEKLGFACTGVELNRRNARFAKRLTKATESSVEVWEGSVFEFPAVESQNVVLALNVFHHLIRTEELHEQLIAFLRRLDSADVMLFEPHDSSSRQLRDAYRNYAADDFAAFVAEHSGLGTIEHLGEAADGRSLYKLSR